MKIRAHVERFEQGLRTCKYFIKLELGEKVSKIRSVSEEISLLIKSITSPTFYLDTKSGYVVFETTTTDEPIAIKLNQILQTVDLQKYTLPIVIGSDMERSPFILDLATAPHILVGGTTGAGKSILTKTALYSLMHRYGPAELQFGLIDPKGTELTTFKDTPYGAIYSNDYMSCVELLNKAVEVMESRYNFLANKKVSSLKELPRSERLEHPYIVIVIDELADIILQDKKGQVFTSLVRLLQKSRAAGIHIIVNTQRPSRDIIKGLLRANLPVQIALRTVSHHDSRIIIGEDGAEKLVGKGDMLININNKITRVQGAIT
jgi:S-DNA-T family DNA segregation ATPase FtsK/SpoIIIE